jgi:cyclophilin family peptidyl-prolyl cis-trans isomerase
VGTAKRERQKANKAQREQELLQQAKRARTTRIAVIVGGAIIAVFGLVFLAGQFLGDDDNGNDDTTEVLDDAAATDDSVAPEPTTPPETAAPVTEPAQPVEVPAQSIVDTEVIPEGCPAAEGTDEQTQTFDEAPPMCLDPDIAYTAVVTTNVGVVEIALDQVKAPNTVNSFVFLARNNYFNDTTCHRIIQEFVVQCGDPTATGTGGPGYTTNDELPEAGEYQIGSLAMANSGPDTQGSQFFIITGDNGVALPPAYSLFGQISDEGLDIVAQMNARGSADGSGTPTAPVDLIDVHIDTAAA